MKPIWRFIFILLAACLLAAGRENIPVSAAPSVSNVQSPTRTWQTQELAVSPIFPSLGRRALALDSVGTPHVVFGDNHLFYAYYGAGSWHVSVVDASRNVGKYASLALDSQDALRIAYYDQQNGDLLYASGDGQSWITSTVDTAGDEGQYASLALTANNQPHIAYLDATHGSLKHTAYITGYGWHDEEIDYNVAKVGDLALDSAGNPHIAYLNTSNDLMYAYHNGSQWTTRLIQSDVDGLPSLALDTSGHPQIAWQHNYTDGIGIFVDRFDGSQWISERRIVYAELPPNLPDVNVSITIDAANALHLSMYNPEGECLGYTKNPVIDSGLACVDFGVGVGYRSVVMSDSSGQARILYTAGQDQDHFPLDLKYASLSCDSICTWGLSTVVSEGDVGRSQTLALSQSPAGIVSHIAFHETGANTLNVLRMAQGAWNVTEIDQAGQSGSGAFLALSPQAHSYLSYLSVDGHLKYAYDEGGSWPTAVVDPAASSGYGSSIVVDTQFKRHISYIQYGGDDQLKYAVSNGVNWDIYPLAQRSVLIETSLALDSANHPQIAFTSRSGATDLLEYARYDGAAWHYEMIETGAEITLGTLVIGPNGWPQVSYCVGSVSGICTELHYAFHNGTQWNIQLVDSGSEFGNSSLALTPSGAPVISYYDATAGDLRFAWRFCLSLCVWSSELVDSMGDVGDVSSLKVGPDNSIHISYHDATNNALRYARYSPVVIPTNFSIYLPICVR